MTVNGDELNEAERDLLRQSRRRRTRRSPTARAVGTITDDDDIPEHRDQRPDRHRGRRGPSRDLHGQPRPTPAASRDRQLRDRERHRDGAGSDYDGRRTARSCSRPARRRRRSPCWSTATLLDEANETFFVNLSSPTNATIPDARGSARSPTTTAPPALSVNDVTVTEGNSGTVNAIFTVTLAPTSGADRDRSVRDRRRDGRRVLATTRAAGEHTHVRARGTTKTIAVPVQRRHGDRGERDLPRQPLERRRMRH